MPRDGFGIEPQWETAKDLAGRTGWTEIYAQHVLDELVLRGMAQKDFQRYKITGRGLAMGEKMGVTIDFNEAVISQPAK